MKNKKLNSKGVTIIELILYIALTSFLLLDIDGILFSTTTTQNKTQLIAREDENARTIMRLISQSIEEAAAITTPNYTTTSSTSLVLTDSSSNTITYAYASGSITKQINTNSAVALSSTDIYVKNLTFTVESEAGLTPSINIKLDLEQNASSITSVHYETTDAQRKI